MIFVADVHLGKLARLLRLLGFDVYWRNDLDDPEIAAISVQLGRTVLTRDRELLRRKAVSSGLLIQSSDPVEQAAQVIDAFGLSEEIRPFTRCSACGGLLEPRSPEEVAHLVPLPVLGAYQEYYQCADCGKLFWKGAHFRTLGPLLERLGAALGRPLLDRF